MVRIKHRYLLLNILFPVETSTSSSTSTSTLPTTQLLLSHHAPTPPHFHAASLMALIRDSVAELFGDYGVGVISGLKVVYFSPATSTAIVRCPRAGYRVVWTGVTFVGSLPGAGAARRRGGVGTGTGTGCVIRVVRVSGTIRKAEEEAVRRARREIVRVKMLDQDQGGGGGGGLLEGLLRGGDQGGDVALGRDNDEAGIEDVSEGGEDVDDDSG